MFELYSPGDSPAVNINLFFIPMLFDMGLCGIGSLLGGLLAVPVRKMSMMRRLFMLTVFPFWTARNLFSGFRGSSIRFPAAAQSACASIDRTTESSCRHRSLVCLTSKSSATPALASRDRGRRCRALRFMILMDDSIPGYGVWFLRIVKTASTCFPQSDSNDFSCCSWALGGFLPS